MSAFNFASPGLLITALPVCALIIWALQHKKPRLWGLHAAASCLAACCGVLLLAGTTVQTTLGSTNISVLLDRSDSMQTVYEQAEADAQNIASAFRAPLSRFDLTVDEEADGSGTDIARAILWAAEALPDNTRRHIVLLTDGQETAGDMLSTARLLQSRGIRLSAIPYNSLPTEPEAQITGITAPMEQALGTVFSAVIRMYSNHPMNAKLLLYQDDELLNSATVRLKNGSSSYSFRVLPSQAGEHILRAELQPEEDFIAENNVWNTAVTYSSSRRTLIVEGVAGEGNALLQLLTAAGQETDLVSAHDIPPTISLLCNYGLVILMNVDRMQMPRQMPQVLKEYVTVYGRSLLVTGGTNTLVYGHMMDTPLEELLPVAIEVTEKESLDPSALMLVIDCSASMGAGLTHMAADTLSAAEMAKRGAVKCISVLNENDFAGIISFSDRSYVLAPLTSMKERDTVIQAVARMATIGGTMYTGALKEAQAQLEAFDGCEKKHIIFISDGNPGDNDYLPVIQDLREKGITLSTIAVGEEVQISILQEMADVGGGSFFRAQDANDLPSFMLSDTVLQQVDYTASESKVYAVDGVSLPHVGGYIRTAQKNNTQLVARTENGDPLFALCYEGSGICGVLTTGTESGWLDAWLNDPEAADTLARWIGDLLPTAVLNSPIDITVTQNGKTCRVHAVPDASSQIVDSMSGFAYTDGGDTLPLTFASDGKGGFTAAFPAGNINAVRLSLKACEADGNACGEWDSIHALNYTEEYNLTSDARSNALEDACERTGGAVFADVDALSKALGENWTIEWDPSALLSWLACILLICSIALRKLIRVSV